MIIRIVKMQFHPEHTATFEALFRERKAQIRNFPGCRYLALWRETGNKPVFFTCSHWESEEALEAYRASRLFKDTWQATKALFAEKAMAWSTEAVLSA